MVSTGFSYQDIVGLVEDGLLMLEGSLSIAHLNIQIHGDEAASEARNGMKSAFSCVNAPLDGFPKQWLVE